MLRIPKKNKDLLRLARLRDCKRILFFLVFCTVWIGSAICYNRSRASVPEMCITGWRFAILVAAVVTLGIFLFRLPRLYTRRRCIGKITERSFAGTYTGSEDPHRGRYDFRTRTELRLRTPDGKRRRITFEQKNGFYVYYAEGTDVIRFHGIPYPLRFEQTKETGYLCIACGEISPARIESCPKCGHTLIDERELHKEK